MHVYSDVIEEIRNYIVWSNEKAPKDSIPPLHTVINEIKYLIENDSISNIILEDFDKLLTYNNLAVDGSEQTNNSKVWQSAFNAAKRIIISFRLLREV